MGRVACVILRHLDDIGVGFGVMLHMVLSNTGHVIQPVQKIGSKIGVGGIFGHIVTECTYLHKRSPSLIGAWADDGFVGSILAAPVTTIVCLLGVNKPLYQ